jgi:hypothetical protein
VSDIKDTHPGAQDNDGVRAADDAAYLDVVVQERTRIRSRRFSQSRMIAGYWAPHLVVNSTNRSLAAASVAVVYTGRMSFAI